MLGSEGLGQGVWGRGARVEGVRAIKLGLRGVGVGWGGVEDVGVVASCRQRGWVLESWD